MRQPRVLNTRPREQAAELSELLRQAGFDAVEAPAIAIEPAWDPAVLAGVRAELQADAFDWVVLASANAGRSLVSDLARARVVAGAATARALGLAACFSLERFSAAAALRSLRPLARPDDRILVPRAADGRDELLDGLRAFGLEVVAPVAYRTVAVPDAAERLAIGGIDMLTLCSPSAAASVASTVTPDVLVACIGATTAGAARAAGLRVDALATETSMSSLVAALEALAGARA